LDYATELTKHKKADPGTFDARIGRPTTTRFQAFPKLEAPVRPLP
jgi:hypothetical protein